MLEIKDFLRTVDLFIGLSDPMLAEVAKLCQPQSYAPDSTIIERHSPPTCFYLIRKGMVKIMPTPPEAIEESAEGVVITLGTGQSFGEMGLVDEGARSATVKAVAPTDLLAIDCEQFRNLCQANTDLGYRVIRNIAADLSFKLRNRNLI